MSKSILVHGVQLVGVGAIANKIMDRARAGQWVGADQSDVTEPRLVNSPGSQSDAVKPRLVKKFRTVEECNAESEKLCKKRADLISSYKKENPNASVNQMFADLQREHPDAFTEPQLIGPDSDI